MLLFPPIPSRRLCSLALVCTVLATPALAAQQTNPGMGVTPALQTSYTSYQESVRQHYAAELALAGYSYEETVFLLDTLPSYRFPVLLRYSYSPAIAEYVRQPHFTDTKLERYLSYGSKQTTLTPAEVVTQVNIGLDRTFYTSVQMSKEPDSLTVLVNKYHYLSSKFVPKLVSMGSRYTAYGGASMHPEAYEWFVRMVDDAAVEGLWLHSVSAYRSYSYQNTLYTRYVSNNGKKLADTFSARAGYSEHQTGLAVDINVASTSAHFENTPQYHWLSENAWKYGFILRYPQDKEHITGFRFEPWHYRYVGQEAAKAIRESGLTWEEYLMGPPVTEQAPSETPAELPTPEKESEEAFVIVPDETDPQIPADDSLIPEENPVSIPVEADAQLPADETLIQKENQAVTSTEADTQIPADDSLTPEENPVSIPTQSDEQLPTDEPLSEEDAPASLPAQPDTQQNYSHAISGQYPTWPGVSIPRR